MTKKAVTEVTAVSLEMKRPRKDSPMMREHG